MFQLVNMTDVVKVPPNIEGNSVKTAAKKILKTKYESTIDTSVGFIILIVKISVENTGKIIHGDSSTYHKVDFSVLTFFPKIQEIVEGELIEITDFGAFIRIGPVDALLHLSQIMDDYLTSDVKQGVILASQSNRTLTVGEKMRIRITAASLGKGTALGKIGVTCRQPFLGPLPWIADDLQKLKSSNSPKKSEDSKSNSSDKEKKNK